jgi:hypothetical protein
MHICTSHLGVIQEDVTSNGDPEHGRGHGLQRRNTTVSVAVDKLVSANKRAELHAGRVSGDAHCVRAPLGRGE